MLPRVSVYKICEGHQPQNTLWLGAENINDSTYSVERVDRFIYMSKGRFLACRVKDLTVSYSLGHPGCSQWRTR